MKKFGKMMATGLACMLCLGGVACGEKGNDGLTVTYQQGTTEGQIVTRMAKAFENKKTKSSFFDKVLLFSSIILGVVLTISSFTMQIIT